MAMKINSLFLLLLMQGLMLPVSNVMASDSTCPDTLHFTMRTLDGEKEVNLCHEYRGKVVLIVNTASQCGYTYQYEGLESLYRQYKDRGLVVLGFPSNDFGGQEPGTAKQIQAFCRLTYGVEFPMFEKSRVARHHADPVYQMLGTLAGEFPQWNFHKYVLDRHGNLIASYSSSVEPQSREIINTLKSLF
jgi:glutathione peroxidase